MPRVDKEKHREYSRLYLQNNRDEILAKRKEHYQENKDKLLAQCKEYKARNKERAKATDTARILRLENTNPAKILLERVRSTSRTRGIPCLITEADLTVPSHCPLLGIPLEFRGKRGSSPSIDRIDNTKGYVPGNVWVISARANTMKSDASTEELERFCTGILASKLLTACG